jgi:hypothetical protein
MSKKKSLASKVVNNKAVHVVIPGDIHRKLRAKLFLKESSIQNFFKLMAECLVNDDKHINALLEQRIRDIKDNKISKLKEINEKDLYNVIEENSPFKKD